MGLRAEDGALHARELSSRADRAGACPGARQFAHHQRRHHRSSRSLIALPMAWAVSRTTMPGRGFVRARRAGRLRDPEFHHRDRLDPAARPQRRPDQRVPARHLRHRPAVQHLLHGRPDPGADLQLLSADLLRRHRRARQHGPLLRGGGPDGRRVRLARLARRRAAAGPAGDRVLVGVRVPRGDGRVRRAGGDRQRARTSTRSPPRSTSCSPIRRASSSPPPPRRRSSASPCWA